MHIRRPPTPRVITFRPHKAQIMVSTELFSSVESTARHSQYTYGISFIFNLCTGHLRNSVIAVSYDFNRSGQLLSRGNRTYASKHIENALKHVKSPNHARKPEATS